MKNDSNARGGLFRAAGHGGLVVAVFLGAWGPAGFATPAWSAGTQEGQGGAVDTEPEQQGPPAPEPAPLLEGIPGASGDPRQELIELFHGVERQLVEVDLQLTQAGAGVMPLEAPADAGLDDLLRSALETSQAISRDIDRILEIAQEMGGMPSSGGSSGQSGQSGQARPGPEGDNPIDSRQQGGQQDREATPEGPREDGSGDQAGQQEQGEQDPEGEDAPEGQEPNGERPDGDGENPDSGANRPGEEQDQRGAGGGNASDDGDRWGELPVRVREVFRNQGREDLPVQYRDWIDAYYRRLNKADR